MGLEGLGLVGRGEAGDFIRSGGIGIGGQLPTNTHGGLLCEGYLHGMNTVSEAVRQVRGDAGELNVPDVEIALATSGVVMEGSAVVLGVDR
jgi:acetyl-CoA acetyltransferase